MTHTADPGASIGYNRFAYANQNPISFLDPTGMFTEDAIMDYILNQECAGDYACATQMFYDWSQDDEWWAVLREAQAGDILYGAYGRYTLADGQFYFRFLGHERNSLTGIAQVNIDGSTAGAMFPGLAPVSLGLLKAGQTKTRMPGAAQEFTAFFSWGGLMSPFGDLLYDRVLHWSQIGDPSSGWKPGAASLAFLTTVSIEALKDGVCGNVPGCGPFIDGVISGYEAGKPTSFTAQTFDVPIITYGRTWTKRFVVLVIDYQSGQQMQDHVIGWIIAHSEPNKVFR